MIKIFTDEDYHDAELEMVRDYAEALLYKDKDLMNEVLYLTEQRMDNACRCREIPCRCEGW